ncbi:MAG TPA: FAD-linked oxidase C-terminal domain-containing protein [Thermodesulfobacteriota bacterium]|nr:FAD-linked oxidase C-terminal domain-containing protein [Thermodesulfobacteriota bacterium]HNU72284.1 FAD-linked oxidase C-terminal domain-containing protein [Thermodesulfobacteriota bacterium]HQO79124.1 FAD-linked oxidase C-terminal domain-containing protein [Thermodesulfobacteriota bacterium]
MLKKNAIYLLMKIVGKENVLTDSESLVCYSYDAVNRKFLPDAVVFPGTAQEIAEILRLANRMQFAVIPRGAGSGFTGGALAILSGVVLVTTRLNRIVEIDADNLTAIVEPGVLCGDFQNEVKKRGLFYPPDPSSLAFSSLGGNAAENAGGPHGLKYGVTRDYVTGLEVVLPTGEIITTGVRTMKGVVGYDITRLIVGSEGTLGIITKIYVRLIPKPEATRTLIAAFSSIEACSHTVSDIIRSGIIPAKLELIDQASIRCVSTYRPLNLPAGTEAVLLIELDGDPLTMKKQTDRIEELCRNREAFYIKQAQTDQEAETLWQIRQAISPALMQLKLTKINEDIVVPRSRIPDLFHRLEQIKKKFQLPVISFGHAGDGNLHVNVMYDKSRKGEPEKAERVVKELFQTVIELGGTISGEHGIGITKAAYLGMELTDTEIALMKRIKRAFDPNDILNPGKIFYGNPAEEY